MTARLNQWWPFFVQSFTLADAKYNDRQCMSRIRFLNYLWLNDGLLPSDPATLTRIAKNPPKVWISVLGDFTQVDDGWRHIEMDEQLSKSKKTSDGRRHAATERWSKSNANADANAMPSDVVSCPDSFVVSDRLSLSDKRRTNLSEGTTSKVVPIKGGNP